MSKPRHDWWAYVKGMIRRYPSGVTPREYRAVCSAVASTEAMEDGDGRMALVDMIFWRRSHTLVGAADVCHVSERTAQRWHAEFIRCVAQNFGLLD